MIDITRDNRTNKQKIWINRRGNERRRD